VKRVFLGCTLLFLSATATFAENDTNQAQTARMGFINMQKVLEESQSTQGIIGQTLHNSINDPNLLILTDGVIYANEKLDLTQSFISDDYRISSESQKKLNELLVNSKIKIGYTNPARPVSASSC
jgi:Skp family chaperone for outer membrane proteins